MTHIENLPHLMENGVTHKNSENSNKSYKPIGDNTLIDTRSNFILPNELFLGNYIPFYFGPRTPMLYVIQNGYNGVTALHPSKIIYCVTSVQTIINNNLPFLYTDGHATDRFSSFYSPEVINDIETQVDFKATKAKFWNDENDLDLKRRKEAEFLILKDIPFNCLLGFGTYNDEARKALIELGIEEKKVIVKSNLYF